MYNETTRLVKVVMPESAGDAIMLSDTAENLYIAYEVVAMVKDEETGKTHFSQLKWKKLGTVEDESESESESEETEPQLVYEFMFESGDLFVAYAADEYPALDGDELQMLSDDSSSGGLPDYSQASNGDVLAISSGEPTWTTPSGGGSGGGGVLFVHETVTEEGEETVCTLDTTYADIAAAGFCVLDAEDDERHAIKTLSGYGVLNSSYSVVFGNSIYSTDSENGYPVWKNIS